MPGLQKETDILIPENQIRAAYEHIRRYLAPTPLIYSRYFSQKFGAEIYFKLETLQPTHSFKARGAINAIVSLPEEARQRGVITASGGNHGLAVSWIAAQLGIGARIYLPTITPRPKVDAAKALGAQVILYGEAWDEANQEALRIAEAEDCAYVHPFDDPLVMAGQGTIVCELAEQLPNMERIVVSIGGGGLISGILSACHHLAPQTKVVGAQPIGTDCMARSIQQGKIIQLPAITSIAESLGTKKVVPRQFHIVRQYAKQVVTTTDAASVAALFELLEYEKLLVEPAASCCLAALSDGAIHYEKGERMVVILCGANVSWQRALEWRKRWGIG